MQSVSTPVKIVVGVAGVLIVAALGFRVVGSFSDSGDSLPLEKPITITSEDSSTPGPVYFVDASANVPGSEIGRYGPEMSISDSTRVLLEQAGILEPLDTNTRPYTGSYTISSLTDDQEYLRMYHDNEDDPSKVLAMYAKIGLCLSDDDCDKSHTKLEDGEYSMVYVTVLRDEQEKTHWYKGVIGTHTDAKGILVTGILSKQEGAPMGTTDATAVPVTSVDK